MTLKPLLPLTALLASFATHAQPAEPSTLGAVVVTAQKRPQPAQDVPISMVVIGEDGFELSGSSSLEEIQHLIPSFSIEKQAAYNAVTIRGIGGGGRNIGFDPRVGVYLDGVYMSQAQALGQMLFDAGQVEVLRGPQGHLFGRNTVAGAVSITTRAPSDVFEGSTRGVVGSKGIREAYAVVSGPLSERVLGRISVAGETRDGFITNLFDGQRLDDMNRKLVRGQIAIVPSNRLRINLSFEASRIRQKLINGEPTSDIFGLALPGGPLPRRTVNFDTAPSEDVDLFGLNMTANYTTESGHVVTAIAGYRDTHQVKRVGNDYGPADLLRTHYVDDFAQHSQEIRLASPVSGRVRYVVAVYHLNERARTDRTATIGLDAAVTNVLHPVFGLVPFTAIAGTLPGSVVSNDGTVRTRSSALFGNMDYELTSSLTLNLGARYTHERKRLLFNLDGSASGNFNIATLAGYRDSLKESQLSPSLGATYTVSRQQNIYAKYVRGFKSGGWNLDFIDPNAAADPSFGTETVDGIEAGTKGTLLDGRLRYDVAAYASRYKNFQVFQFVDLGAGATSILLRNAAKSESHGVDAGLTWRASSRVDIGIQLGWNQAVFKQFDTCSTTVDCTGHRLPYAPKYSSAVTARYVHPLQGLDGKLELYGEYARRGKAFTDPVNDPVTQMIPARDLVNVPLGFFPDRARWDIGLWVRNLFDEDAAAIRARDFLGNEITRRIDPRTMGIEARVSF
jgi:iron complex outermembrane receptor protein